MGLRLESRASFFREHELNKWGGREKMGKGKGIWIQKHK